MIPDKNQFSGYIPGVVPKPIKLPRYLAKNNHYLQTMIELEIHQLEEAKKEGGRVNGTPTLFSQTRSQR
jgi:hypothetical protein